MGAGLFLVSSFRARWSWTRLLRVVSCTPLPAALRRRPALRQAPDVRLSHCRRVPAGRTELANYARAHPSRCFSTRFASCESPIPHCGPRSSGTWRQKRRYVGHIVDIAVRTVNRGGSWALLGARGGTQNSRNAPSQDSELAFHVLKSPVACRPVRPSPVASKLVGCRPLRSHPIACDLVRPTVENRCEFEKEAGDVVGGRPTVVVPPLGLQRRHMRCGTFVDDYGYWF